MAIATVELTLFLGVKRDIRFHVLRQNYRLFLVIGVLVGGATAMTYTAVTFIDPGTASLLAQTSTLFALGLSLIWLRERLSRMEWLGILVALVGVFAISFQKGDYLRLGLGGGGSFNQVGVDAVGESGLMADFLENGAGQLGVHGSLSLAIAPYPSIPLRITGDFTGHWVNFSVCSGEDPPQTDPLCDPATFKEVSLGLSYDIPRR